MKKRSIFNGLKNRFPDGSSLWLTKDDAAKFGDSHIFPENYLVIQRLMIMLCDELKFNFIFKQVWHKSNGLTKGHDNKTPVYDYEEILYFANSKEYYFNPIKYHDLSKEVTLGYFNGRPERDGTKTPAKWVASKEYETFRQFIDQNAPPEKGGFAEIITSGTASAESREIIRKYGIKHPAIMPFAIPLYPILCFSKPRDIVVDSWLGTGTTLKVALATGRKGRGFDLEKQNVDIAKQELQDIVDLFI